MLKKQFKYSILTRLARNTVKVHIITLLLIMQYPVAFAQSSPNKLRIWVANSAEQTKIITHLTGIFQSRNPGVEIEVKRAGALQVLDEARAGKADIVITHYPKAEQLFLSQGHGTTRILIMYNEFAILGPKDDPLKIQSSPGLLESLRTLANDEVEFLIPSNRSGTYKKLTDLWTLAKVKPEWIGYESTNASAKYTLQTADMMAAYTFIDMGTYLSLKNKLEGNIIPVYRDNILLQNHYSAMVISEAKHSSANEALAYKFLDYLISTEGQKEIENYGPKFFGTKLYTAAAHLDTGLMNKRLTEDADKKARELHIIILLLVITVLFALSVSGLMAKLRKKERNQRITEERFRMTVTGTNDGIWDFNLNRNTVYLSPRFKQILAITDKSENYPNPVELLKKYIDKEYRDDIINKFRNYIDEDQIAGGIFYSECPATAHDGRAVWLAIRGKLLTKENKIFMIGSIQEITHEKKQNAIMKKLEYQAMHDVLTGLPNRALLYERLERAALEASRNKNGFALMVIDLDKFKPINDTYGHRIGDALLKSVSERICQTIRSTDTVARIGGDEFAVVLCNVDESMTINIARKIHNTICMQNTIDGIQLQVGVSIGIALSSLHGDSIEELLQYADEAMYTAKREVAGVCSGQVLGTTEE